jgi:two-component system cell cycle sensor histidine kinase/response regulator CckA
MSSRTIDVEETPHILTAVQDVSEQRRLEAQLVQSQKLEAVGRLAGGVAHDFNNLLTAVMGYCDLLSPTFAPNDARARDVAEIRGAAQRGATLTKQLLGFARQQTRAPREVELSTVVRDLRGLWRGLLTKGFDLRTELDRTAGTALIDPGQLEQVVTNLVVNARDAMPNGGPITIRTRREGAEILLEVTDAGTGIPAHVRPHIFEPFFTTKEVGKGSGLGLATCYGIVRQAAGSIRAFDAAHGGTTIQVRLPRVGERLDQSNESASVVPQSPPNGTRRVIVVEDDDMVRGVTRTLLERAGYQVEAMSGAPEALSRLLMDDAHFDLVVSDIVMPRMSGPAFARVLAATHPDLPILFMSGYTADETMREDIAALGHPFLAKPYTTEDLLNAAANAIPQ